MSGIIVGVDGSPCSRLALDWAMREAMRHHVLLTVITVRPGPVRPATGIYWGLHKYPEGGLSDQQARQSVQDFVAKVAAEIGTELPEVSVRVATGDAAEELVRAAREADMLVVGSRGSGGFTRLLMGSVSSKVAHHAACPVVVVPGIR